MKSEKAVKKAVKKAAVKIRPVVFKTEANGSRAGADLSECHDGPVDRGDFSEAVFYALEDEISNQQGKSCELTEAIRAIIYKYGLSFRDLTDAIRVRLEITEGEILEEMPELEDVLDPYVVMSAVDLGYLEEWKKRRAGELFEKERKAATEQGVAATT